MKIETFTLSIPDEIEITFLNYGGIIQNLRVPDKNGKMDDVVLGFENPEDYKKDHPYFGALIGRYANRIANGHFQLDGKGYELSINNGPNSLHGGLIGFDRIFWNVTKNQDDLSYTLIHQSPDGHEGYPGNLKVEVTYTLSKSRELIIDYKATTDQATPVNFTNHSYFNLSGLSDKNILEHELWINADKFTDVDSDLTPTGILSEVTAPMDFREHKTIERDLEKVSGGYDHNYVLNNVPLRDPKARLVDPYSGRMLEIFTTQPGLQFYSGNFLDGNLIGKKTTKYQKYQGLCLETQHFPDSPNHNHFPNTILRPGEVFTAKTIYKFSS